MELTAATFAYPAIDGPTRAELATALASATPCPGAFVLNTCLRTEVVVAGDRARLEQVSRELLGDRVALDRAVVRSGSTAVRHIFRVAAGLESPIIGEREILTQYRQALAEAEEHRLVTGLFAKVLENGVAVGRTVRTMLPDSPHDSMAAVAAQMAGAHERVAVLGAGTMGRSVALNLLALPAPPAVTMIVRSPAAVDMPGVEMAPMDTAPVALTEWPAVVSATSAKGRLLGDDLVANLLSERTTPLLLVDLAMPPDIVPPRNAPIHHIDIDALARRAQRHTDTTEADTFVARAAVETFRRADSHHEVGPVIGEMMRSADNIVDQTVERFAGRLGGDDDRGVLRQTAHTVARTLLAGPVSYLRSEDPSPDVLQQLVEMFGVEP